MEEHEELPKGQKIITITRNEDYHLKALLQFEDDNFIFSEGKRSTVPGTTIQRFTIIGSNEEGCKYSLESSYVGNVNSSSGTSEKKLANTAEIGFHGVKMENSDKRQVEYLIEWCLNGPRDFVFSRVTQRNIKKTYNKDYLESKDSKFDSLQISLESSSFGVKNLIIKTNEVQFVIEKVPEDFGPTWSSNIAIKYKNSWGKIPDVTAREKILEICSFIFGRQLLPIGYSKYDASGHIVEAYARDPWGKCVKSNCLEPDNSPINIRLPNHGRAEGIIGQLLPNYLNLSDSLCLKEALSYYWLSQEIPLGANLPILAAGLESIITGWFRCNKSKSKGLFLDKVTFSNLLKAEFETIDNKLKGIPNGDKIAKRIRSSVEFGMTARYSVFFEELQLPISEGEWAAIKERSVFVHGEAIFDRVNWTETRERARTFEALFNKVFLRILGYSGTLIDRSIIGWPDVQL